MILETIKAPFRGHYCIVKRDTCGKEFKKSSVQVIDHKNHFCSTSCKRGHKIKSCMICGKPYDNSFYDKSDYRPLCSKQCYSVHFDNWYSNVLNWNNYESNRKMKVAI